MALDLEGGVIKNVRAIIWKNVDGRALFLLTQEPSGSFTLPGGCKDVEDIDLPAALRRELQEELFLDPADYSARATDIKKEYEGLYNTPPERAGKNTVVYLFAVSGLSKEPGAGAEIKGVAWVTADDALRMLNAPHMKELFRMGAEFCGAA